MRRKRVLEKISAAARDRAAILCATRASAEATGNIWLGSGRSKGRASSIVWTPDEWSALEKRLAVAAWEIAINKLGARRHEAHVPWAEAEAMIRCGFRAEEGV